MVTQHRSRGAVALAATAFVAVLSFLSVPSQAIAASSPTATDTTPASSVKSVVDASSSGASAQALPTVQIDGVVWSQAVAGNTVFAGGNFAKARPAGAAPGINTVTRTDLLAFSLSTGVLSTTFAPTLNGEVKAVAVSPDGSTLFVGGAFTTVNGSSRTRIAAFNISSGALISTFAPTINGSVLALAVTNSTVYAGGSFTTVNGRTTTRLAAFDARTGASTSWSASADSTVNALVITPDGTRVIAGGRFQNVNGAGAYGLAALDASTGALLTWNATKTVQDAGANAAILSLTTDGTAVYGAGYVYGAGGNLEGVFSADPESGTLNWLEDCHGDTYGTYGTGNQVYVVSHEHYCGNIGAFGEANPRTAHRATAFTTKATGTITPDTQGYASFAGVASPSMVNWFPDLASGTFTGQSQAAWSITGSGPYVVLGGEFPTVNGTPQQGLVRFATRATAASKQGPVAAGSASVPRVLPVSPTTATLTFQPVSDLDNSQLAYNLIMNGATKAPIWSGTVQSTFWARPAQAITLTGLTAGTKYTFALQATDPDGNTVTGSTVSYTSPTTTTPLAAYSSRIAADGATSYSPLDDVAGSRVKDYRGALDGVLTGPDASTSTGVIAGDAATSLTGTTTLAQSGYDVAGPTTYSEQVWIRTTTTAGGPIMDFGNGTGTTTTSHDREVYMGTDGRVVFSVYTASGGFGTITSKSALNDGQWHQITATEGGSGTALFIDGALAGSTTSRTSPNNNYQGVWRLGAQDLGGGWPSSSGIATGFAGDVDEWAIYPTAISATTVQAQYAASGRAPIVTYPGQVSAAGASDYYRLNDASGSSTVKDSIGGNAGTVTGSVTSASSGAVGADSALALGSATTIAQSATMAHAPSTYTEQVWIRTTTTSGGTIMEYGDGTGTTSFSHDREVYLGTDGKVRFSVSTSAGSFATITSANALNDGQWHQITATEGSSGTALYVDGALTGSTTSNTSPSNDYPGRWRLGAENLNGSWPSSSGIVTNIAGDVDEWATYPTALSAALVQGQYAARAVG